MTVFAPERKQVRLRAAIRRISVLAFPAAIVLLLLFPGQIRTALGNTMAICISSLVPSLFPFMVLTCCGADPGTGKLTERWLGPVIRRVFRLPSCCASPLLLGFLGGYPAGAKGVSLLLRQDRITREQAERMLLFCVSPGPAFTLTFVAAGLPDSARSGWILLASVTFTGLLLGILSGLFHPVPGKETAPFVPSEPGALTRAVAGASRSVLTMCSCILVFSALTAALRAAGIFRLLSRGAAALFPALSGSFPTALSFLLEVTEGVRQAAETRAGPLLPAFGLGFGGLCVHWQILSFFPPDVIRKGRFLLFRFLHGLLSAGMTWLLIRVLPGSPLEVWAASVPAAGFSPLSGTPAGGLSLLLMCLAFLVTAAEKDDA